MKKIIFTASSILIMIVSLTACAGKTPEVVEVTRVIPQTVEVTRVVPQTVVVTQIVQVPAASTPEPLSTAIGTPGSVDIDPTYFDGIIVITQYYTFLGHGLYEEAYRLLSASAQRPRSLEDYVRRAKLNFKAVEIVTILPYFVAVRQQGGQVNPDPIDKNRFAVQIRAWGEGNMSGSRQNGELQDLFLGLVQEDDVWKIDSFATAPLP
jgi:hypothetical protein